ncbi:hypothetical protein BJY21_002934 [Kineosphaera limosa]|uniref:DUF5058 domain-containing protein n=1 Tax=Kineosphaera limosa NBRC 100340 TaxID=1184609 RepID=K6WWI0_9MICO|nr:DUF5058 family protein [Kineosphaera limosa]NYE01750.1 hypothetical protein [Kineosphaera limosa]GAB96452.1 hypothetical protein KILIM_039_00260 [Kineosphaera limosa NBRC 100340]
MIAADSNSTNIGAIANSPVLWVLALSVLGVILVQSAVYMVAVRKNAEGAGMSQHEVYQAFRAGGVAAIGPSLAVVLVAIALLPLFGTPSILVRIGLIGSAATETASASIAAGTMGANLGDDSYTQSVFIVALFAMSLSGACWMISTLILTPILSRGQDKLTKVNPALMAIVPSAALLAAFAGLTVTELPKSSIHVLAVIVSAAIMGVCLWVAKQFKQAWLREWALGFAIIGGLVAAYVATN